MANIGKLDVDAQTDKGRFVDEDTLQWWAKQDEIQDRAFSDEDRIRRFFFFYART